MWLAATSDAAAWLFKAKLALGKGNVPRVLQRHQHRTGVLRQASEASCRRETTGPSTRVLGLFICQGQAIRRHSATPSAVRAKEYSLRRARRTPVDDCLQSALKTVAPLQS